jgi:hypothetical protein
MCHLRHINDPVLSSLKMECICLFYAQNTLLIIQDSVCRTLRGWGNLKEKEILQALSLDIEAIKNWTEEQHTRAWIELPGLRHSKLFIGKPCKVRTDTLLKLNRSQQRMITAVYTQHAPVRGHLFTIFYYY